MVGVSVGVPVSTASKVPSGALARSEMNEIDANDNDHHGKNTHRDGQTQGDHRHAAGLHRFFHLFGGFGFGLVQ